VNGEGVPDRDKARKKELYQGHYSSFLYKKNLFSFLGDTTALAGL